MGVSNEVAQRQYSSCEDDDDPSRQGQVGAMVPLDARKE